MKPAARIGDLFLLPPTMHQISAGMPTVLINGMPAAVMSMSGITHGSTTVYIGGLPAARLGDPIMSSHILTGASNVLIGD